LVARPRLIGVAANVSGSRRRFLDVGLGYSTVFGRRWRGDQRLVPYADEDGGTLTDGQRGPARGTRPGLGRLVGARGSVAVQSEEIVRKNRHRGQTGPACQPGPPYWCTRSGNTDPKSRWPAGPGAGGLACRGPGPVLFGDQLSPGGSPAWRMATPPRPCAADGVAGRRWPVLPLDRFRREGEVPGPARPRATGGGHRGDLVRSGRKPEAHPGITSAGSLREPRQAEAATVRAGIGFTPEGLARGNLSIRLGGQRSRCRGRRRAGVGSQFGLEDGGRLSQHSGPRRACCKGDTLTFWWRG